MTQKNSINFFSLHIFKTYLHIQGGFYGRESGDGAQDRFEQPKSGKSYGDPGCDLF